MLLLDCVLCFDMWLIRSTRYTSNGIGKPSSRGRDMRRVPAMKLYSKMAAQTLPAQKAAQHFDGTELLCAPHLFVSARLQLYLNVGCLPSANSSTGVQPYFGGTTIWRLRGHFQRIFSTIESRSSGGVVDLPRMTQMLSLTDI
jgi:hypothetical protein